MSTEETPSGAGLAKFSRPNYVPPGGKFFYTVPETGQYFESRSSKKALLADIRRHLTANNIPEPGNLADLVEDYICRHVGKGFCVGGALGESSRPIGFFDVVRYTETLLRKSLTVARGKFAYVPVKVAKERARVCMECPLNIRGRCSLCSGLRETAAKLVANKKTEFDPYLGVCDVCGCMLNAKIHMPRSYLKVNEKQRKGLPGSCWLVKPVPSDDEKIPEGEETANGQS